MKQYITDMTHSIFTDTSLADPDEIIAQAKQAPVGQRTPVLAKIANLAKTPAGHSCGSCSVHSESLCLATAIKRHQGPAALNEFFETHGS